MATPPLDSVIHYLHRSLDSVTASRSDGDLLARFTIDRDPAAFAELVRPASRRYLSVILDDELRNLPPACRAALVACHLEGLSTGEAAQQLGVAASTLKSRLQRGRDLLRERLHRRGIDLSVAALTAVLAEQCRAGATPALVRVTVQAALCVAASGPGSVATRPP